MGDKLSKEQRRRNMQAIKSSNSGIEKALRKALWAKGYRYRINYRALEGKPDIVFTRRRVAIFCDSEFWHGYDWDNKKHQIHSNTDFWIGKIESNIRRDDIVSDNLRAEGWTVLRFWGEHIKRDLSSCVETVEGALEQQG